MCVMDTPLLKNSYSLHLADYTDNIFSKFCTDNSMEANTNIDKSISYDTES